MWLFILTKLNLLFHCIFFSTSLLFSVYACGFFFHFRPSYILFELIGLAVHANCYIIFEQNLLIFIAIVNFNPLSVIVWCGLVLSVQPNEINKNEQKEKKRKREEKILEIVIDSHRF